MAARQTENDPDEQSDMRHVVKRRGLIAGAAALVASAAVLRTSEKVAATDINSGISYRAVDPYSDNYVFIADASTVFLTAPADVTGVEARGKGRGDGVHGIGGNTNGIGVRGNGADGSTGVNGVVPNHGYGVYGTAGVGYGVYGTALGGGIGVGGDSSNVGVAGRGGGDTSGNTTGFPVGVRGSVPDTGYGVYGNAGNGTAVYGNVTGGNGVTGVAVTGNGVTGQAARGASKGVYGKHTGGGYGVYGEGVNGHGVYGTVGDGGYGVTGVATTSYGVVGQSTSGTGVYGSTSGAGNVAGGYFTSTTTYGIIGNTTAKGYSGLTGITSTPGVAALAASSTTTAAYAAYFTGTTVVQGDFYVVKNPDGTGGGKYAAVAHADGSYRGVYCTESPEPWFEDFGEGKVVNGRADVALDPEFAALIHTDTYHVFLTAHSDQHLHVPQRTPTGFRVAMTTVGTVQGTTSAAVEQTFSWRVVGKRKDIAGTRLPKVDLPKIKTPDPNNLPRLDPAKKP